MFLILNIKYKIIVSKVVFLNRECVVFAVLKTAFCSEIIETALHVLQISEPGPGKPAPVTSDVHTVAMFTFIFMAFG